MNYPAGTLTPCEFIEQITAVLPLLTDTEKDRVFEHAQAWATWCSAGDIPPRLTGKLKTLEEQCRYLTMQDAG